jgi:hypothetical protein
MKGTSSTTSKSGLGGSKLKPPTKIGGGVTVEKPPIAKKEELSATKASAKKPILSPVAQSKIGTGLNASAPLKVLEKSITKTPIIQKIQINILENSEPIN